jgi:hypothetical protein
MDMIEILPKDFTEVWHQLDAALDFYDPKLEQSNPQIASQVQQGMLAKLTTDLWNTCKKWNLEESLFVVNEAREWLVEPSRHATHRVTKEGQLTYEFPKEIPPTDLASVHKQLVAIRRKLHEELDNIRFALISKNRLEYFENDNLFGKDARFPREWNTEVKAAGNCLAADLNTAAVYHLIRAAEMGMRALTHHLGAIPIGDQNKQIKIEEATWKQLLDAIEVSIEQERKINNLSARKTKGTIRDYEILWEDLNILKDHRNRVMHNRLEYNASEAEGIFHRVKDFMRGLAGKLS